MADVIVKVLEPATEFGFMSLDEAKTFLGISPTDTTGDPQLEMIIDMNSATIGTLCNNRVFAREKVRETWRCLGEPCGCLGAPAARIFLTHWPVKEEDIESVETPYGTIVDPTYYEFEEASGKMEFFNGVGDSVVVTYTGGYDLPGVAPFDQALLTLKQATGLLVRESRTQAAQEAVTGIRMIAHKEARVMFHSPQQQQAGRTATTTGGTAAQKAVENLLSHFTKYWV